MIGHLLPTARKSRRPDLSSCKYRKKRKPPIMLAWLGCFFAHLSYSLRTVRFAASFFMLRAGPFVFGRRRPLCFRIGGLPLGDWSRRPIVAGERCHFDVLDHAESQARVEIAHCLFIEVNKHHLFSRWPSYWCPRLGGSLPCCHDGHRQTSHAEQFGSRPPKQMGYSARLLPCLPRPPDTRAEGDCTLML